MLVWVLAPSAAYATSCRDWNRMSEQQQWSRIDRMISDAITGQKGRSYRVNRNAIGRCLADNSEAMFWDFSDICSDSSRGGMRAINARFKDYLWTCVN